MRLDLFSNPDFDRGASRLKEAIWLMVGGMLFSSWLPGSGWRRTLLRAFGASVGSGVIIKPRVRVKFPWRLSIGAHCWIGEDVWIDNLASVSIDEHSCVSQGVYLCTGSHDWSDPSFALIARPIHIGQSCWIAAKSTLAPGTVMEDGAVLAMSMHGHGVISGKNIHMHNGKSKPRKISY